MNKIKKLLSMFFLLYFSNSMLMNEDVSGFIRLVICFILVILICIIQERKNPLNHLSKTTLFFLVIILGLQFVTARIVGIDMSLGGGLIVTTITAFFYVEYLGFEEFCEQYVDTMKIICLISVIVYFVYIFAPDYLKKIPTIVWHSSKTKFINLGIVIVPTTTDDYFRNWGFFVEPGVYQYFVLLAMYLEIFVLGKYERKYIILYIVTILTTMSSGGIVGLIAILIALIFHSPNDVIIYKYDKKKEIILLAAGILLFYLLWDYMPSGIHYMFTKFNEFSGNINDNNLGSAGERMRGFKLAWNAFCLSPIWGIGTRNFIIGFGGNIVTCTPINWFAMFGIVYGIIMNSMYMVFFSYYKGKMITKIFTMIAMMLIICGQEMSGNLIIMILVFYGYKIFREVYVK